MHCKPRAAWVESASPRSFDSAPQALCHANNLSGAPLRMTSLCVGWNCMWSNGRLNLVNKIQAKTTVSSVIGTALRKTDLSKLGSETRPELMVSQECQPHVHSLA